MSLSFSIMAETTFHPASASRQKPHVIQLQHHGKNHMSSSFSSMAKTTCHPASAAWQLPNVIELQHHGRNHMPFSFSSMQCTFTCTRQSTNWLQQDL
jgi:hypothetical protein